MPILPGAESFQADGGDVAVLLLHGFTGTPQSLRDWAEHHAAAGLTVRLPRLPGHGTTWQECNRTRWQDWYSCAERELLALARDHTVVVAGMSNGGALALRLAQEHPDEVAGLVLVNPAVLLEDPRLVALPVLRHLVPSLPGIADDIRKEGRHELAYDRTPLHALWSMTHLWRAVRGDLSRVTQPILLLRSAVDHVVPASSSAAVLAGVTSRDVREVVLPDSYHVATLDHDAPRVLEASLEHVRRVTAGAARDEVTA
ncbi:alpha/beta hydrolase [Aquipuribacter nitratireducens]|uniref:Alpha/beta hydrolase n=1 Tax=Aquipuribacter nitratireducens TaxID=650104 RepID=A0ABW0GRI0_9MICO